MITWFCFCPFTAGALFLWTVALQNTFCSSIIPDGTEGILHPCRWIGFPRIGASAWRMARGNRLTPAQRLAWHRQPGWSQLGAIPFPFPLGSVCAHGELLLLSCHCCFIIITRLLSQSPVPNLASGNASSWEVSSVLCMAYLLRMQWKGTSRWW